jgi:hydrogenase maturation factor
MIAFDAQTSGGLLICAPSEKADLILSDLKSVGLTSSSVIGVVTEIKGKYLSLEN